MSSSTNLLKVQQSSSSFTSVKTVKLCHTWVIEDFLTYFNSAGHATNANKSCKAIESSRFKNEHVQFYLQCYPYEYNFVLHGENRSAMYLAVKLHLVSSKLGKTPISFEITCLSENWIKNQTMSGKFSGSEPCAMGVDRFLQQISINRLLVDDKLSINCELTYITTATSDPYESIAPEINHFEKMAQNFVKLRKDENLCDLTLKVRGREFRVHKFLLCAQSPVFEAMFLHDMKEKQENRVEITDVDSVVFEKLLDFIYSGKSDCVRGREDELLAAADKYGLEQLKDACAEELCKKLTPVSVTDLLVLADTYNVSKLKQKSLDYLKVHGQDTIQAMFANNRVDNLVSAFRHLAVPGSQPAQGSSSQSNIGGANRKNRGKWRNGHQKKQSTD